MVLRKTLLALLCLTTLCQVLTAQVNPPQACPIYIAHELHKGEITSVARSSENIDCRAGSVAWEALDNTKQKDQVYSNLTMTRIQRGECLRLTDFELNIPPGAEITGLQVDFIGHRVGSALLTTSMYLIGNGGQKLSSNQASWVKGDDWPLGMPGLDQKWWYGGKSETWGVNLTDAIVNDPDFGIEFQVRKPIGRDTSIARIDHVRMTVHYTPLYTLCHDSCTVFYVDPIPEANSYHWTLPPDAMLVSKDPNSNIINLNVKNMNFGIFDICVETQSNQGRSIPCCSKFRLAECQTGSIGDRLWSDIDDDGIQDPGEPGLANISLDLIDANSQAMVATTTTDSLGIYTFNDVNEGHYYIIADVPPGLSWSPFLSGNVDVDNDFDQSNGPGTSRTFFLASGTQLTNIDGGVFASTQLGDFVWNDLNENGIQDLGEPGIPDVRIYLFDNNNVILDSTLSDQDGLYFFQGLSPGTYAVEVEIPTGFKATVSNAGMDDTLDSDLEQNGRSSSVTLAFGQNEKDLDAGLVGLSKIDGQAFYDRAGNGIQDAIDTYLGDIEVILLDGNGNTVSQSSTDSTGYYCFDSISTGLFQVMFIWDTSFVVSPKDQGLDDEIDSDINTNGKSDLFNASLLDTTTLDGGGRPICQALAPEIELEGPKPCFNGVPFLLDVVNVNAPIIPSGYDMMYLMVDPQDLTIQSGSNVPVFNISQAGGYTIFALVYNDDVDDPEYLDLSFYINGNATITQLQSDISSKFLCASFSLPLSFVIDDCASISGLVWYDQDLNEIQSGSDIPLEDIQVSLLNSAGLTVERDTTDVQGRYNFDGLLPGLYRIEVERDTLETWVTKDAGADDSIDSDVDQNGQSDLVLLIAGQMLVLDAGRAEPCDPEADILSMVNLSAPCYDGSSITINVGRVGAQVPTGYSELFLLLDGTSGIILDTNNNPEFILDNAGQFRIVTFVYNTNPASPEFFDISFINVGTTTFIEVFEKATSEFLCSDFNLIGRSITIQSCGKIVGQIWQDDEDGIREVGEPSFPDIAVNLLNASNQVIASQLTSSSGEYVFNGLLQGLYRIEVEAPADYEFTGKDVGFDDTVDSDVDQDGLSDLIILASGNMDTIDAGLFPSCEIGLGFIEDIMMDASCWSGQEILLSATEVDKGIIPNGFRLIYLLSRDGWVYDTAPSPAFVIDSFGLYCIHAMIYDPRPQSAQYFDLDQVLENQLTVDETFDLIFENDRCAEFDIDGLCTEVVQCASVGDRTWEDSNKNGIQDPGENGFNGISVDLFDGIADTLVASALTSNVNGEDGSYRFDGLMPGPYYLVFSTPFGFEPTLADQGGDDSLDSDLDEGNGPGSTSTFLLAAGMDDTHDAGFIPQGATIGDLVWEDMNGNGIQDINEPGINGLNIELVNEQGTVVNSTTSANNGGINGTYQFSGVLPASYFLRIVNPQSYLTTLPNVGMDEAIDNDLDNGNGAYTTSNFTLVANQVIEDLDLGLFRWASVGDRVWYDDNNNGLQDPGEGGVNGIQIKLFESTGSLLDSVITSGQAPNEGSYLFDSLVPGTYYISVDHPNGTTSTLSFAGSNAGLDNNIDESNGVNTSASFVLASNAAEMSVDVGLTSTSCIGDLVWNEISFNGLNDFFERGINDVTVRLRDVNGFLIDTTMTNNDTSGNPGFYQFVNVQPGNYYLEFDFDDQYCTTMADQGMDDEIDSDVTGDNGPNTTATFSVALGDTLKNIDLGLSEKASIGNRAWCDANADGLQDADEEGINDIKVFLYTEGGTLLDSTLTADLPGTTDAGFYKFEDVSPGSYYLIFGEAADKVQTLANAGNDESLDSDVDNSNGFGSTSIVSLSPGENERDIDAGYIDPGLLKAKVGDYVWLDRDNDGIQDRFESGLNGVIVELFTHDDILVASTVSDFHPQLFSPGYYSFEDIEAGQYYLVFTASGDYEFAASFAGFEDEKDSDISNVKAYGSTNILSFYAGEEKLDIDAGFVQVGSLGNYVWLDENANGYQDPAESGMNGVKVWLYDRSGVLADSTSTGPDGMGNDGYYVFEDMDPSGYYLKVDLPNGYAFTEPNTGGDDTKDSDIDHSNGFGTSSIINISPGEHDRDADAGLHPEGIIGRMAWRDDNYNGVRDAGEKGVEKVKVYLYNLQDSMIYQTETNNQGTYIFDKVPMGKYYVMFDVGDDYDFAPSNMASESKDCDVTHRYGYGTTDAMDIYPGQSYLMLDAGVVPSIFLSAEILEFEVDAKEELVDITWSMGDETEVESYEVERRHEDETDYQPVSYTTPNSSSLGQYKIEDELEKTGTYFYRLKVMTLADKPLYSVVKTVDLNIEGGANPSWRVYPNPVVDYIYLESKQGFEEDQSWEIVSLDGRIWGVGRIEDVLQKIDLSHLSSGVYVLHLKDQNRILARKMVQLIK